MSYILPEAEREMDSASMAKDRRIAELEQALREVRADISPCPRDVACTEGYLPRGLECPDCLKSAIGTIDTALGTTKAPK